MASDSVKLYGAIYVALLGLAASKFIFFEFDQFFTYEQAFAGTMIAAAIKSALIVGYYQHLRWENRSLTYVMALALGLAMLLMAAATYSIS
ncbi:cytochrome C oxidase subunit IV family protein [Halorubrum sp. DTA46]|uniref:cytochrome C oxidase subunit IV family protein n=1 Tax=Halorubrum sp. DTA46 TaxID=3402162 RepID=UPI003AAD935F